MKVGDKVVCVKKVNAYNGEICPVVGEHYTVRDMYYNKIYSRWAIRVVEIINTPRHYNDGYNEADFPANKFRPVDYSFGEEVAERLEKTFQPETIEV